MDRAYRGLLAGAWVYACDVLQDFNGEYQIGNGRAIAEQILGQWLELTLSPPRPEGSGG